MLGNTFGWPHLLIILAIVLLIFGGAKLPGLARGLGQSIKVFRNEVKTPESEKPASDQADGTTGTTSYSSDSTSETDPAQSASQKPKL